MSDDILVRTRADCVERGDHVQIGSVIATVTHVAIDDGMIELTLTGEGLWHWWLRPDAYVPVERLS